jgi:CheY-like chemotaxis protein
MLDFHLPDMGAREVMEEIYNIRPDAKIIIETADSKTDEQIKETLRGGAYQYLEKPIRFENLKNIFEVLEAENNILKDDAYDSFEKILSFLNLTTRISLARLQEYSNMPIEILEDHLHKLEDEKKATKIEKIREIACNQCDSVIISHNFFCMSCHSSNFKQEKLIEHFKCSNVSPERSYKEGKCPKCSKELKALGVDFKSWDNYYTCNDCGNKFQNLLQDYMCLKCNNQFTVEKAKWITSDGYKITNP